MKHPLTLVCFAGVVFCLLGTMAHAVGMIEMPGEVLRDKIKGGLLGQMLGNLNGLPHELNYISEPGQVTDYVPSLPEGAWTDDDTDFEWVYVVEMQRRDQILLPPDAIAQLWQERINRRIWCSNQYARQLMDLGLEPPWTGSELLNPWAGFNISGQFLCESFGLIAPGMPQTASRIGLNYTRVAIDGEPAQTTQLFDTMIASAFVTTNIQELVASGLAAVDPGSQVAQIVRDVQSWHAEHPDDWRATRALLKDKYTLHGGDMRDRNGYELNTGATIAALLYGAGDFAATLQCAFNLGWDCDNSAATAGTIVGVLRGHGWMMAQGWRIVDRYRNTTRDEMPMDETISRFAERLTDLAEKVIRDAGGERTFPGAEAVYRIPIQEPDCVLLMDDPAGRAESVRAFWRTSVEDGLLRAGDGQTRARSAYLAICLDLAPSLQREHPEAWRAAIQALSGYENVAQVLYHHSNVPTARALQAKAAAAGLARPAERKPLW